MLGNPRFLTVLAIEFAMGASAKWSAEVQARGDKFWPVRWLLLSLILDYAAPLPSCISLVHVLYHPKVQTA